MKILHYDAFTQIPNMGNPAGIVLDGQNLGSQEMLEIAKEVGFNETTFVQPSEVADLKLVYYTPGHEMDLCGHGTIAAMVAAYEYNLIKEVKTIETKAGILQIDMQAEKDNLWVTMEQKPADFFDFAGDVGKLAAALNIETKEIDHDLPIVFGNTGIWTLLLPVRKLGTFKKMRPDSEVFPEILEQCPHASVHPFCLKTYNDVDMHGRHFSSPFSGTVEDPATGTASGVMGAYFLKYINKGSAANIKIEQGQEMGKDAIIGVQVNVSDNEYLVKIQGTAQFVKEIVL